MSVSVNGNKISSFQTFLFKYCNELVHNEDEVSSVNCNCCRLHKFIVDDTYFVSLRWTGDEDLVFKNKKVISDWNVSNNFKRFQSYLLYQYS